MESLIISSLDLLALQRLKETILLSCKTWKDNIPHCLSMGNIWSKISNIEIHSFIHHLYITKLCLFLRKCVIVFNRDTIGLRRRHIDLQVLCILQEEVVPNWSLCCNINGFDKLDIYKRGYKK